MKRHALMILAAFALPFGVAHADEADGSQLYRSGMGMHGASPAAHGQQAGVHKPAQSAMPAPMHATATMGAQAGWLTREQVRADAIRAMRAGTIPHGEKGGFPQ